MIKYIIACYILNIAFVVKYALSGNFTAKEIFKFYLLSPVSFPIAIISAFSRW